MGSLNFVMPIHYRRDVNVALAVVAKLWSITPAIYNRQWNDSSSQPSEVTRRAIAHIGIAGKNRELALLRYVC